MGAEPPASDVASDVVSDIAPPLKMVPNQGIADVPHVSYHTGSGDSKGLVWHNLEVVGNHAEKQHVDVDQRPLAEDVKHLPCIRGGLRFG